MLTFLGNISLILILISIGIFAFINFEDYVNDIIHQYILFQSLNVPQS